MKTTSFSIKWVYITFIALLFILPNFSQAQWTQVGADIDGEAIGDESGYSVSISTSGDRLAIGARLNRGNGSSSGHVRVYNWDPSLSIWTQLGSDIDGESLGDESGRSVSLNSEGNRIAIGAPENDGIGVNAGHVRVYEWDSTITNWRQLGSDIDGESTNDSSGISISLDSSGNRLAIGALTNDGNGNRSGHVRIYEWNDSLGVWIKMGADIDGEAANDLSGVSVSLNSAGDRVSIGALLNDGNGINSGQVRIFEWNPTQTVWLKLGVNINGEASGDQSGVSVKLNASGNRVAIGATNNDGNGISSGHVRIYEYNGNSWNQLGNDIDGEASYDFSGFSVSMNSIGDRIAIGSAFNSGNGSASGHVRVYEWNLNNWIQLGIDIDGEAVNDRSGFSVCLNDVGNRLAVGAPRNDGTATDAGHVRVFQFGTITTLKEIQNKSNLILYPNPTKGVLNIETKNSIGEIIQITSITGAVLKEITISQNRELIDLNGFKNGLYFLRFRNELHKVIVSNN